MIPLLSYWILLCAGLVASGWLLSLLGDLDSFGYLIFFGLYGIGLLLSREKILKLISQRRLLVRRLISRRLLLPGIFAASVALLFLKGILSPPFHDDGLCYRIPRAMHWIMDQRWHWINAEDARLDVLGTVSEWLTVPILLFLHTDRLVFLPNWICHLFLPGLIFSVWRKFQVAPRIAWLFMWVLPSGFCFALQAVNTSNDSLGAFFILAAFFFGLRGIESRRWSDFAFSILCMALTTGVKLNLLSLGLAWGVMVIAGWRVLLSRPVATAGAILLAVLVSFVPTALLNASHVRGWTGLDYVPPVPPAINFICTTFNLIVQNLIPPLPIANHTNPILIPGIQNSALGDLMARYSHLPIFYSQVAVQQAGIGFIAVIFFFFCLLISRPLPNPASGGIRNFISHRVLIMACIGVAFLHYLLFVGSDQPARLICAFYLLLPPLFLCNRTLKTQASWPLYKFVAAIAMFAGLYLALFATENPLGDRSSYLSERRIDDDLAMAKVREIIPSEEKSVGVIRFYNQRETWLWKPYGSRKVFELPIRPDPTKAKELGIEYVAVSNEMLADNNLTIDSWLKDQPWSLEGSLILGRDNSWYFVKLQK